MFYYIVNAWICYKSNRPFFPSYRCIERGKVYSGSFLKVFFCSSERKGVKYVGLCSVALVFVLFLGQITYLGPLLIPPIRVLCKICCYTGSFF